ncbi:hypothetical protein GCM10017673_28560 [Streptosporangium violaceochromogenes]|nr:hypothetical protein GCM10017673_28560 [Streptosporangium violaceochromogenes]
MADGLLTDVIDEINGIRATLGPRDAFREPDFLHGLAERLLASPVLRRQPIVRAFAEDARSFGDDPRLRRTKLHINGEADNHVFSMFDASYFPSLSLDYLTYRKLPTDEHLARRYASNTMPVTIERMSDGFASRVVVALFPENHLDGIQDPDDLIFYFIDKFVERHLRLTRRLVSAVMAEGSFPLVAAAGPAEVERASSWWVRLHEYHHRQGDMPIPDFLPTKRLKPLAGLEELRVDISSMLACLNDDGLPREDALLAYEYILSERLLRYSVEGVPRPNYDAVASQVLFDYLIEARGIHLRDGVIHLDPGLPAALAAFLAEIETIERRIHTEPAERVQRRLLDFANRYADFDEEKNDYRHIPYFAEIKQRLGV